MTENDLDFYRQFVEHVTIRLKSTFERLTVNQKYRRDKKSCKVNCRKPGIAATVAGNHTLCRIVDLTDNERGKLEWFSQDQRRDTNGKTPKKFILIFHRDKMVCEEIESVDASYRSNGEPKSPYNFECRYANISQDSPKW